jgi:hypothetical protein
MEFNGRLPRRQRGRTEAMRVVGPSPADMGQEQGIPDKVGSPALGMAALKAEGLRNDPDSAKVLQLKVLSSEAEAWKAEEQERWNRRTEKRRARAQRRRAAKKKSGTVLRVTQSDVQHAVSARDCSPEDREGPRRTDGVVYEPDYEMPEPTCQFREALLLSIVARDAVEAVEERRDVLLDGFGKLVLAEARRMESLAAGNVAGENDTREGVAHQLITAVTGLIGIAANDWEVNEDTPLRVSRARRRYQQRVWKGRAKALRNYENERAQQDEETGVLQNESRRWTRSDTMVDVGRGSSPKRKQRRRGWQCHTRKSRCAASRGSDAGRSTTSTIAAAVTTSR